MIFGHTFIKYVFLIILGNAYALVLCDKNYLNLKYNTEYL